MSNKKPRMEKKEVTQIVDLDNDVFCYTPISNEGDTKRTSVSVKHYSEDKDLYLAVKASLESLPKSHKQEEKSFVHDEIRMLDFTPQLNLPGKRKKKNFCDSITEEGQSSKSHNDPEFVCEICIEPKSQKELFSIKGCAHAYCTDCMVKYVASKLQENISKVPCPESHCKGLLEPEHCRSILPHEVFDRWSNALCEAAILGSQRFYCPFKDCSAMLLIDDDGGGAAIRESVCPNCWRMFCARCKVPWHSEIVCEEFQKLHKDEREREDILLMKLAMKKNWRRCPTCRIYVEKTQGCQEVRCRCGTIFDYGW